jgi:hypothetical protein
MNERPFFATKVEVVATLDGKLFGISARDAAQNEIAMAMAPETANWLISGLLATFYGVPGYVQAADRTTTEPEPTIPANQFVLGLDEDGCVILSVLSGAARLNFRFHSPQALRRFGSSALELATLAERHDQPGPKQ